MWLFTSWQNFLQTGRISLLIVAVNIITCFWCGVERKISWMSLRMSAVAVAVAQERSTSGFPLRRQLFAESALAEGFEHAVALVEDEVLQLLELEVLAAQQAEDAAGRAHDDVRRGGLERRLVRGDGHA